MKKILLQMDTDTNPSVFDRVVAVDADIDQLFSYGSISPNNVEPLVHGVMFTRGGDSLKKSAIFIGGSNVEDGEKLLEAVQKTFFGPVRVSVMHDSNGCNTTASAAVLCAKKHLDFSNSQALVLGGTGPVGRRVAELLASENCKVALASRTITKAKTVCDSLIKENPEWKDLLTPCALADSEIENESAEKWLEKSDLVVAAGAAGVEFYKESSWNNNNTKVAIDLNAVPPAGLEGIGVIDKAKEINETICYGAIGVGGLKMKIHKAGLKSLFESNDKVLDTKAIYELGGGLS